MKTRPVVVQHSSGERGAGGPLANLERVLTSHLADKYTFVPMHQAAGTGGIDVRLIRQWVRMLRSTRPDLVHIRGLQNEGFQAIIAARLAGCRNILVSVHGSVRDLQFAPRSLRRFVLVNGAEPATLRLASHVATVCHFAAERDFIARHSAKFLGVIPNGVAVPEEVSQVRDAVRAAHGITADRLVMISVSRLTWEKGFKTLREAAERLPEQAAPPLLLIVGDGTDRAAIEHSFTGATNVEVRFLGRRHDVSDLLAAADLFLFPTLHENLSNALLEAMAHGLPVVASAVGGNSEVLEAGGGILVPPGDAYRLAQAIGFLLADPVERHTMGKLARETVLSRYSRAGMLDALDRAYQLALANGARRG